MSLLDSGCFITCNCYHAEVFFIDAISNSITPIFTKGQGRGVSLVHPHFTSYT